MSVEDVAAAWPVPPSMSPALPGSEEARIIRAVLMHLATAASGPQQQQGLGWPEFRDAVRLWHLTGGHLPSLRSFLLLAVAEAAASTSLAMIACQASSMACAAVSGPSSSVWPQLAAVGGVGAFVAVTLFDSSCVKPLLQARRKSGLMPAGASTRRLLFAGASFSTGMLLAPAVPLLASTVGDPQTKGYGPLAVAGLAIAHASTHAALLASLPEQGLSNIAEHLVHSPGVVPLILTSAGAGLATAALGVGAARASNREGAVPAVLAAAALVSFHAAVITNAAVRAYARGVPEPLRAPIVPMKKLLALGAWGIGDSTEEIRPPPAAPHKPTEGG